MHLFKKNSLENIKLRLCKIYVSIIVYYLFIFWNKKLFRNNYAFLYSHVLVYYPLGAQTTQRTSW